MKSNPTETRASVVQLKARLSEYLRRVKAGHELVITERGLPIARILPLDVDQQKSTRHERLVRAGVIRPGRNGGRVPKSILETPPVKISGVLDALLAERDEDYT